MSPTAMKTEAELRHAVIDRLIAASLSDGKAREAVVESWRAMAARPLSMGEGATAA